MVIHNNSLALEPPRQVRIVGSSVWVNGFNIVCQQCTAMYDSGCQICFNWSKLKPGFKVSVPRQYHVSTTSQINMIPHPVTLNCHWANQPWIVGSNLTVPCLKVHINVLLPCIREKTYRMVHLSTLKIPL